MQKRNALLKGTESYYNFEEEKIDSFYWDSVKAEERNQAIWQVLLFDY